MNRFFRNLAFDLRGTSRREKLMITFSVGFFFGMHVALFFIAPAVAERLGPEKSEGLAWGFLMGALWWSVFLRVFRTRKE